MTFAYDLGDDSSLQPFCSSIFFVIRRTILQEAKGRNMGIDRARILLEIGRHAEQLTTGTETVMEREA